VNSISTAQRIRLLQGVILLVLVMLAVRVLTLQVIDPAIPPGLTDGLAPRVVSVEPPRGRILDRNGEVLAWNVPEFRVQLIPGELPTDDHQRRMALVALERTTGVTYATLEAAANSRLAVLDPFAPVLIRDGMDSEEAIAMRAAAAGLPGVRITASPGRTYLSEPSLAHILGHTGSIPEDEIDALLALGYPMDGTVGRTGVEVMYEEALRGTPGQRLVLADPQGREVEVLAEDRAVPGEDLVLSIDLGLQRVTAEALARGMDAGLAVVRRNTGQVRPEPIQLGATLLMDVHSGELLASVSLPSYDPNLFVDGEAAAISRVFEDPARPLIDRTYMEVRSPGSIYKPLVALAALEEGVATEHTRIFSSGAITIRDQFNPSVVNVFRDWMAHGELNMKRALARSSNIYFYLMVGGCRGCGLPDFDGMGADALAEWSRKAGLGRPTGIDLPGEVGGLVPDSRWKEQEIGEQWLLGDSYPFSIGQGYLTVTPLQMAVVTAALANGGTLVTPRVAHGYRDGNGTRVIASTDAGRLDGTAEHYRIVQEGLLAAAEAGGTAVTGRPAGTTIGGKTGTAEFGQPYPSGEFDTHAWFIGYAPYDNPEVAVAVYLEYGVGATHAGPVAREILAAYFAMRDGTTEDQRVGAR